MQRRLETLSKSRRTAGSALFALALLVGVTGCSTSNCQDGRCDVSLSGIRANTTVDTPVGQKTKIEVFNTTPGQKARLIVNGRPFSCDQGETKDVDKVKITCKEVGNNSVKLTVAG